MSAGKSIESDSVVYMCSICSETVETEEISSHACSLPEGNGPIGVWVESTPVEPTAYSPNIDKLNFTQDAVCSLPTEIESNVETNDSRDQNVLDYNFEQANDSQEVMEPSGKFKRREWTVRDSQLLLQAYIKHCKKRKHKIGSHYFWSDVLSDLKPHGHFTRKRVQDKFQRLKRTYISDKLPLTHQWPFSDLVEKALEAEKGDDTSDNEMGISDSESDDLSDQPGGLLRWTKEETLHLLQAYQRHLPKFYVNGVRKLIDWKKIWKDFRHASPRQFSVTQMRAKIHNCKNIYWALVKRENSGVGRSNKKWYLFRAMTKLTAWEERLRSGLSPHEELLITKKDLSSSSQSDHLISSSSESLSVDEDTTVEYLEDPEESNSSNASNDTMIEWTEEATVQLIHLCFKHLLHLKSMEDPTFWPDVAKDFNVDLPTRLIKRKFEDLMSEWQQHMEESEEWPFGKDLQLLSEVERNIFIADHLPWTTCEEGMVENKIWCSEECLSLVETCRKYLSLLFNFENDQEIIWKLILVDLGEDFAQKFSPKNLFDEMVYLKNSSRCFGNEDSEAASSLLKTALTEFIEEEKKYQSFQTNIADPVGNSNDYDIQLPESSRNRWSINESRRLIRIYKKYLPQMVCCSSNNAKGNVWLHIASELGNDGKRQAFVARHRINTMKTKWKTVRGNKERSEKWPLFAEMNELIELENVLSEKVKNGLPLEPLDLIRDEFIDGLGQEKRVGSESVSPNQPITEGIEDEEPAWFKRFRSDARRRHEESISVKTKILKLLEDLLSSS